MKAKRVSFLLILPAFLAAAATWWCLPRVPGEAVLTGARPVSRPPRIHPDYRDLVIPPNIAPLNFRVEEPGRRFFVRAGSVHGQPLEVLSRSGDIEFPGDAWRRLLAENRGEELSINMYALSREGEWLRYGTLTNKIAEDEIDSHIAYRFLRPEGIYYRSIGIYQRDLETFENSPLLHARWFGEGCLNCHSFRERDPSHFSLHVRGGYGAAALFVQDDGIHGVAGRLGYTAWHPSGKVVVFSRFDIQLYFHTARGYTRDATDSDSQLVCYRPGRREMETNPPFAEKSQLQVHPTWSPDGRYLYFASAPKRWADYEGFAPERYAEVRYDLKRVRYDVETDRWGPVETVLSAERTGKSSVSPKVSPDGRFLLFCMCDHGNFPIYQPESDLYVLNLQSGDFWKLECNSEFADSWHCWSSNGRWIVFSSKRPTGIFTRLYLCHVDSTGHASRPFLLPQRDPGHDDDLLSVYNLPEFIKGPVSVSPASLLDAVQNGQRVHVEGIQDETPQPTPSPSRGPRPE